jgi:hypothetical protein
MEERVGERRRVGLVEAGMPLSSVLSPFLRRGERKENGGESSRPTKIRMQKSQRLLVQGSRFAFFAFFRGWLQLCQIGAFVPLCLRVVAAGRDVV